MTLDQWRQELARLKLPDGGVRCIQWREELRYLKGETSTHPGLDGWGLG